MIYIKWIVLLYLIIFDLFFVYINLKTKKKTGLPVRGKSKDVRIASVLTFVFWSIVLISLFIPSFYYVFAPISFLQSDLLIILGCILLFIGLIIGMISARELGASWRVGILEDQKTELVQTGIYRFCRNPYFISYYIMFLAFFLIVPSVVLLLVTIATILGLHYIVKKEEKYLERVHGLEYRDYCRRIGGYLPKIRGGNMT